MLLLVVVGVAIATRTGSPSSPAARGPLDQWGPPLQSIGMPADAGRAYSYGTLYIVNRASDPVTIRGIELVDASPGLELLGARFVAGSTAGVGTDFGFPPSAGRTGIPAAGAVVRPGEPSQVILGITVAREGVFTSSAVAISYTAGDRRFREVFPTSLRVCAPSRGPRGIVACPTLLEDGHA